MALTRITTTRHHASGKILVEVQIKAGEPLFLRDMRIKHLNENHVPSVVIDEAIRYVSDKNLVSVKFETAGRIVLNSDGLMETTAYTLDPISQ